MLTKLFLGLIFTVSLFAQVKPLHPSEVVIKELELAAESSKSSEYKTWRDSRNYLVSAISKAKNDVNSKFHFYFHYSLDIALKVNDILPTGEEFEDRMAYFQILEYTRMALDESKLDFEFIQHPHFICKDKSLKLNLHKKHVKEFLLSKSKIAKGVTSDEVEINILNELALSSKEIIKTGFGQRKLSCISELLDKVIDTSGLYIKRGLIEQAITYLSLNETCRK